MRRLKSCRQLLTPDKGGKRKREIYIVFSAFISTANFVAAAYKLCTSFTSSPPPPVRETTDVLKTEVCDLTTHNADGAGIAIHRASLGLHMGHGIVEKGVG